MASKTNPAPWRYEPQWDSDGETAGVDHFVLDASGDEIACPPHEGTARLMAAAPALLEALKRLAYTPECWCLMGVGHPLVSEHSKECRAALAAVKRTAQEDNP